LLQSNVAAEIICQLLPKNGISLNRAFSNAVLVVHLYMSILFWICFLAEFSVVIWWIFSDMKLQYQQPNPYSYLAFFYLMLVLVLRFGPEFIGISSLMVFLPAIPLSGLLFIIVVHSVSGGKWN
jgi:hypothetical protein